MDPNAAWTLLCDTLRALHTDPHNQEIRVLATILLESMASWLRSGGSPPTID
jgi:hypothetical protein